MEIENAGIRRTITAIVVFLIILGALYLYIFEPFAKEGRSLPVGAADFRHQSVYQINPETILESLDQGVSNVFRSQASDTQAQASGNPVLWSQSDYLKVAGVLNQLVWEKPLKEWNLYSMDFVAPCQDQPEGFSLGSFYYFKTTFHRNGRIRYTTQELSISSGSGEASWSAGANFPHPLFGWKKIRANRLAVTAQSALRTAEENGGREARALVENKCKIHVGLTAGANWQVFIYQDVTGAPLFRLEIDPSTGSVE